MHQTLGSSPSTTSGSGADICMFSSDYPHGEGGRNPLERFDESLAGRDEAWLRGCSHRNFAVMMGRDVATG